MNENVENVLSTNDWDKMQSVLIDLNEKFAQSMTFAPETKHSRSTIAKLILTKLENLKCDEHVSFSITALNCLRIVCRDKEIISEIEIENLVTTLTRYGQFLGYNGNKKNSPEIIIEAQKCLYNILHLSQAANEFCVSQNLLDGIINRIQDHSEYSHEIQKFDIIILFFMTAKCPNIRHLIGIDTKHFTTLLNNLKRLSHNGNIPLINLSAEQLDLICEILKLTFNGTCSIDKTKNDYGENLTNYCYALRDLLLINDAPEKLISNIVNAWTALPFSTYRLLNESSDRAEKRIIFQTKDMTAISVILSFLQIRCDKCKSNSLLVARDELSPVLMCLVQFCRYERCIRKYCRSVILPPMTNEVLTLPEEGNTLRNHLCRLLMHINTEVCKLATEFLFVMCKENTSRFVKYTGYGNAAGKLAEAGLLIPTNKKSDNFSSESEDSDTEEYEELRNSINPVTGRVWSPKPEIEMTEEQKEYEAMKLLNQIDKLMKHGVISPSVIGEDGRPQPASHVNQLLDQMTTDFGRNTREESSSSDNDI